MVDSAFSNGLLQRSFYFFFLVLWSIKLLPDAFECPMCTSSIGISYALLYLPVALLLLAQTLINNKILWRITFSFFIICSLFILIDNYHFYDTYHTKMGSNLSDFIKGELFLLMIVLIVDFVIYQLKPIK